MGETKNNNDDDILQDMWMVRSCETYRDEYKDCGTFSARFHQKYTTGKKADCLKWKEMYDLCMKYRQSSDFQAARELLQKELALRNQRIADAKGNDVWEYRTSPPGDWNKQLPHGLDQMKIPDLKDDISCTIL